MFLMNTWKYNMKFWYSLFDDMTYAALQVKQDHKEKKYMSLNRTSKVSKKHNLARIRSQRYH